MKKLQFPKLLWIILITHFLAIFFLSSSTISLPNDMIENLLWGRNFAFAYDKHPPFFAWESYFVVKLFGGNLFFYHILTPLHQVVSLFFVYLLASKMLSKEKALLAVVLAQGIIVNVFYYKFNGNTANLGFYACTCFVFYKIVKEGRYKLFPLLGFLCGLAMLIKYSALLLIGVLGLIGVFTKEGRKAIKSLYIIPAILLFFLVISPNAYDVFINGNDGAIRYLTEQSSGTYRWIEIPRFILAPFLFCLPMLIAFFAIKQKAEITIDLNFKIIWGIAALPFLVILVYMILLKAQVGMYWLSMYYFALPVALLYSFSVKDGALKRAMKIVYSINIFAYSLYLIAALINPEDNTKEISKFLQEVEQKHLAKPAENFICNESRRLCGMVIIYGTADYSKVSMPLNRWSNPFDDFALRENKPEYLVIIGEDDKINMPGYSLYRYEKSIPKYHKFKVFESLLATVPVKFKKDVEKLQKPIILVLTIAINKKQDAIRNERS